jgi:type II secretory pathway pseudopilin PulG
MVRPMQAGEPVTRPARHAQAVTSASPRQAGFTLLGLLFLIATLGAGLAALGQVWQTATQRQKEAELLFVGNQYRQALQAYFLVDGQQYPKQLEHLLADPRFPHTVRHLRRLWPDPISGGEWTLVRNEMGGIQGVHSPSTAAPRKTAGFAQADAAFEGATRYADWIFLAKGKPTGPNPPTPVSDKPEKPGGK